MRTSIPPTRGAWRVRSLSWSEHRRRGGMADIARPTMATTGRRGTTASARLSAPKIRAPPRAAARTARSTRPVTRARPRRRRRRTRRARRRRIFSAPATAPEAVRGNRTLNAPELPPANRDGYPPRRPLVSRRRATARHRSRHRIVCRLSPPGFGFTNDDAKMSVCTEARRRRRARRARTHRAPPRTRRRARAGSRSRS